MLAQLCHVLAAGQSTQVAQEHQQDVPPSAPRVAQGDGFAVGGLQGEVWGNVANF